MRTADMAAAVVGHLVMMISIPKIFIINGDMISPVPSTGTIITKLEQNIQIVQHHIYTTSFSVKASSVGTNVHSTSKAQLLQLNLRVRCIFYVGLTRVWDCLTLTMVLKQRERWHLCKLPAASERCRPSSRGRPELTRARLHTSGNHLYKKCR